ncbi:MAG: hypothetical protein FJ189_03665 [Gammaproteobacteria bacterium]|nr:hypothetical protein [Gammaproteobacteria bacterium]
MITVLLSSCYSSGGWVPVVEPDNDPKPSRVQRDQLECQSLARQSVSAATGIAPGGVAIGAAAGNPGTGVARGTGGAIVQGMGGEDTFKRAYINCMRRRGYGVID